MAYTLIWEENGLMVKLSGSITNELILQYEQEMYSDERFKKNLYFIWDSTLATHLNMTEVQNKIEAAKDMGVSLAQGHIKCAFITNNEMIKTKIEVYIEYITKLQTEYDLKHFESLVDAREWIKDSPECI